MEACCSFKSLVGRSCGFDVKDRKRQTQIVPLLSCTKNISKHLSTLSFSGPQNEIDLILSRAALFDLTICPSHRPTLGISWTRVEEQGAEFPTPFQDTENKGEHGQKEIAA